MMALQGHFFFALKTTMKERIHVHSFSTVNRTLTTGDNLYVLKFSHKITKTIM